MLDSYVMQAEAKAHWKSSADMIFGKLKFETGGQFVRACLWNLCWGGSCKR